MQLSLLSLIEKARPRRALLTTYTFSVYWFETFALPALRRYRCEQIDLLVDYRMAQRATQATGSQHAGSLYRIIPVAMPKNGVFHPKLAYFEECQGKDWDLLLVGSGNLTHPGQGKNLEIFESVTNLRHPHVFEELSSFLMRLTEKYHFSPADKRSIVTYALHAAASGKTAIPVDDASRTAWLIDCLDAPTSEQFVSLASTHLGEPSRLTVLSPYHAPSGGPVARMAGALGVKEVRVSLDKHYVAPFDEETLELPLETTSFVLPVYQSGRNMLHAKHFEIEGLNGSLMLSGSNNATVQSLETTRNVEVSLARRMPASPLQWESAEPRAFVACDFSDSDSGDDLVSVQASWSTDDWLEGKVHPVQGKQSVTVALYDGLKAVAAPLVNAPLSKDGKFRVKLIATQTLSETLLLIVSNESFEARGWVNREYELQVAPNDREALRAATRASSGDYHDSDVLLMVNWLRSVFQPARKDAAPLRTRQPAVASGIPGETSEQQYQRWLAEAEQSVQTSMTGPVVERVINVLLRHIAKPTSNIGCSTGANVRQSSRSAELDLLDDEFESPLKAGANGTSGRGGDQAPPGVPNRPRSAKEELVGLASMFPEVLAVDASSSTALAAVKFAAHFAVEQAFTAPPMGPDQVGQVTPRRALEYWISQYSKFPYSENIRKLLTPVFCAVASLAVHLNPTVSTEVLKEAVALVAQHDLSSEEFVSLTQDALQRGWLPLVSTDLYEDLEIASLLIAESETMSTRLTELLATIFTTGDKVDPRKYPGMERVIADLRLRATKPKLGNKKFGVVETPRCACCNISIKDEFSRLKAQRFLSCKEPTCGSPLFFGLDPTVLDQRGLAPHYRKA